MDTEKELRSKLCRDIIIPDSTAERISDTLEQIRISAGKENKNMRVKNRLSQSDKRAVMLIAAAVLMLVCAGTALAYTIGSYDFINSIWRSENSEEQAEQLEEYIGHSGTSQELMGYTVTVEEYLIDENGMGHVRYSIENAAGLPDMYDATNGGDIYESGDSEVWFAADKNGLTLNGAGFTTSADSMVNNHTFIDGKLSTKTKAYFTSAITVTDGFTKDDSIIMDFSAYDAEYNLHSVYFTLPSKDNIPSAEYGDSTGGIRTWLSPVGIRICGPDFSGAYFIDELILFCGDDKYIVIDSANNINSSKTATIALDGSEYIVFDRMVSPESVTSVTMNGYILTEELAAQTAFNAAAAPKQEADVFIPADRTGLVLNSAAENPFHYRRSDGIEVFVLTADTLSGCTDDDIHAYTAFKHGYLTYEEFLANVREDYDEFYSSREYYAPSFKYAPTANELSADSVIDIYLETIAKYYPEVSDDITYVEARYFPASESDGFVWCMANNTDALWESEFDSVTGEMVWPKVN